MALIVVLGVMNGLRDDLRDRILVANPHLRVLTYGALAEDGQLAGGAGARAASIPRSIAAAPEVLTKSLIVNSAGYPSAVDVVGLRSGHRQHRGDHAGREGHRRQPLVSDALPTRVDWRHRAGLPPGEPALGLYPGTWCGWCLPRRCR